MSADDFEREPARLIDGKLGSLLREANRELATELDQPAAFRRLRARLAASRRHHRPWGAPWLVAAAPLAIAAIAILLVLAPKWSSDAAPELVAERWNGYLIKPDAVPRATSTSVASGSEPSLSKPAPFRAAEPAPASQSAKRSADVRAAAGSASVTPELPLPLLEPRAGGEPAPRDDELAKTPDCLSLARQGQTRQAEACFLERAQGSGLGAEMALYEVARLRRDVLADADGALRALAEYRKRFPSGSLRREADMSQLELLIQLGRSDDALNQSQELLSSSASGERAAELHLLRGHILRKAQSRFAAAAHEYELAEGAGARGGDASYFRALCLEALGRGPEAASLLTQYLEQPQRPYAEDARRRLERIKP
ncbi:MAG TPA: hypothetical protein VEQ59_14365 [Polyangiaceae bacterium]|nr:hypothetical protein [Polyangiaceae bacterium]